MEPRMDTDRLDMGSEASKETAPKVDVSDFEFSSPRIAAVSKPPGYHSRSSPTRAVGIQHYMFGGRTPLRNGRVDQKQISQDTYELAVGEDMYTPFPHFLLSRGRFDGTANGHGYRDFMTSHGNTSRGNMNRNVNVDGSLSDTEEGGWKKKQISEGTYELAVGEDMYEPFLNSTFIEQTRQDILGKQETMSADSDTTTQPSA